jgi:hypothetical protein
MVVGFCFSRPRFFFSPLGIGIPLGVTEKEVKIHATLDDALYIVNFITDEYKQKAFIVTVQPIHRLIKKDQQEALTVNTKFPKTKIKSTTSEESNSIVHNYRDSNSDIYSETSSNSDSEKPITKH